MQGKSKMLLFTLVFLFAIFSTFLIITTAARFNNDHSLSLLAAQFLKGHISLEPAKDLPLGDISIYNGKYYMYFGPFASLILMPFVALFGKSFSQIIVGIGTLVISFFAIYSISQSFKLSRIDSLWLSLFFVFSTVLFSTSVINITSYLVEAGGATRTHFTRALFLPKEEAVFDRILFGLCNFIKGHTCFGIIIFFHRVCKRPLNKTAVYIHINSCSSVMFLTWYL